MEIKVQLLLPREWQDNTHLTDRRGLARAISGNGIEAAKERGGGRTLNLFSKYSS